MLMRAFGASAFGLRGGIAMEAAQANVYHALASCAGITGSIRIPINHSLDKKRLASAWRRCLLQRCESAVDAHRLGNMRHLCESRRGSAPLNMRATPKAPHSALAAISQLYASVRGRRFC